MALASDLPPTPGDDPGAGWYRQSPANGRTSSSPGSFRRHRLHRPPRRLRADDLRLNDVVCRSSCVGVIYDDGAADESWAAPSVIRIEAADPVAMAATMVGDEDRLTWPPRRSRPSGGRKSLPTRPNLSVAAHVASFAARRRPGSKPREMGARCSSVIRIATELSSNAPCARLETATSRAVKTRRTRADSVGPAERDRRPRTIRLGEHHLGPRRRRDDDGRRVGVE
jgi:hypothetical protein